MAKHRSGNTVRIEENSKLLIKWRDANGELFTERAETHDLSDSGISFYLKTPVWVDSHLTITIASSELFGRLSSVNAKVVRVQVDPAGRQLVAARFD
jgi:PilZ domain-containing protein